CVCRLASFCSSSLRLRANLGNATMAPRDALSNRPVAVRGRRWPAYCSLAGAAVPAVTKRETAPAPGPPQAAGVGVHRAQIRPHDLVQLSSGTAAARAALPLSAPSPVGPAPTDVKPVAPRSRAGRGGQVARPAADGTPQPIGR